MRFSHTQLSVAQECRAKYRHYYLRKQRVRKRPLYFVTGSAVHAFLEYHYSTGGRDQTVAVRQAMNEFDQVDRGLLNAEEIHELECQKSMVRGIVETYPKHYTQDFDQYAEFLTEREFELELAESRTFGNKVRYSGKIDIMAKDQAGDWWIIETKTTAPQAVNDDFFRRVHIDSQVLGYMHGAKQILGKFPAGVVYNVIKKTAIRLKKGESKSAFQKRVALEYRKFGTTKEYFLREELLIGKRALDDWERNTRYLALELNQAIRQKIKVWPKNTGACVAKFGACPYLEACISGTYDKLKFVKEK